MKMKRFLAPTMSEAIAQVRESLGADAAIVSNRTIDGGVELVAAIDEAEVSAMPTETTAKRPASNTQRQSDVAPTNDAKKAPEKPAQTTQHAWVEDPTLVNVRNELQSMRQLLEGRLPALHWHEMSHSKPLQTLILKRLLQLGIEPELGRKVANEIPYGQDCDYAWQQALKQLTQIMPVTGDKVVEEGGVVALVGSTGVGKTTTIAKLAARFALRYRPDDVALVTTDSYRIAAFEQLKTYGKILGVNTRIADTPQSLKNVLDSLSGKRLVLIDTAGISQRDLRLVEHLSLLTDTGINIKNYLVLSSDSQTKMLDETIQAFNTVPLSGMIATKTDEAANLGGVMSMAVKYDLPLCYLATGQRVPEDLQVAKAEHIVRLAAELTKENGDAARDELAAQSLSTL